MFLENKNNTSKLLSFIVSAGGLIVMAGWIFDISILKSLSPSWISMKFSTAFSFVLSGISLYFIVRTREGDVDKAYIALYITSLSLILIMGTLFFSTLMGVHTGEEDLFIKDTEKMAMSVVPGRPSVPAMFCFILTAVAGIVTTFNPEKLRPKLRAIGITVSSIGALAVAGYLLDLSILYYYINGVNSALAFHTAVLFVLLGTGLLCL